tara:strand:+ start:2291 stop:2968 length:678 start_codon:yes stop_codon:yes gene_type:complete
MSLYFVNFNIFSFPFLSSNQSEWANFGSYIGGTLGPLLAFLAYLGVREQLSLQRKAMDKQVEDKAFDDHIGQVKESFERINQLSIESVMPLECHLGIDVQSSLTSELQKVSAEASSIHILEDIIHASRLIQGAEYIYRRYLYLIEQSASSLNEDCPLNEHKWNAGVTWRQFEKRATLINSLAIKANRELIEPNPDIYEHEQKEILMSIGAFEGWAREWKTMGLGF